MKFLDILWDDEPGGNADHIDEHGLTKDDVAHVLNNPEREETSRSSDRLVAFGYTEDGEYIVVVYEWIDAITVYPITAYALED